MSSHEEDRTTEVRADDAPTQQLQEAIVIRAHEEEADVGKRWRPIGTLRGRKTFTTTRVSELVPRNLEELNVERVDVDPDDDGRVQTLPDGTISIPIFEEELVVVKRTVLRERVLVRKHVVTTEERVETEIRKEHVDFEADEGLLVEEVDS